MLSVEKHSPDEGDAAMTFLIRTLTGVAIGAIGALTAAGVYAEATRMPDQP
jgi:hypothetical protein